ncbi:cytidine and dCMP deaminase domain-containing protein 1 [Solea senegalensis]|uniref:Cytidine and dCMP deaminase domain-containing protein 1 n=1 Tax=Solea senegalensis TaxID=28829 RepID=A0AAV6RAB0_SOLSE|nr:cytidine and dCMP deaminase domain-containing protein 1 [Solea senegalensis]
MPRGSSRGITLLFLIQYRRVKGRAACVFSSSFPVTIPLFKPGVIIPLEGAAWMEGGEIGHRAETAKPGRETRDSSTQTESRVQGHGPRLSRVNLFTLLSLWMELFPQEQQEEDETSQIRGMGLVVVQDSKVVGFHFSGVELHAGQAAIIQHGSCLADCQLYFSRRPCATCLKMIINAGVSQISFWPGDPEVSVLKTTSRDHLHTHSHSQLVCITEEAVLDAVATETLKSNSRPHICVLLQPLAPALAQFIEETSRDCDFMDKVADDEPGLNTKELFNRERLRHVKNFSKQFLVEVPQQHQEILMHMGLDNYCVEPYFSNLRHNMRELVEVLATVTAGVPLQHHGFYREQCSTPEPSLSRSFLPPHCEGVSQEVARHCIIQARLLAYRTGSQSRCGCCYLGQRTHGWQCWNGESVPSGLWVQRLPSRITVCRVSTDGHQTRRPAQT